MLVEGNVRNVNLGCLELEDGEDQSWFVREGRGVKDDVIRHACDLADSRKRKTAIADAGMNEDVLDGIASLFLSDD